MWKDVRVKMNTGEIEVKTIAPEYRLLGGRSLIAEMLTQEVNPKADPLGEENKLIFSLGLFAGTPLSTAHRLSVGAKSPLTGGIKESNVGGIMGSHLAGHGIKALVFEGLPENDEWKVLYIDPAGEVSLISGESYQGLNNYDVVGKAREIYGDKIAVATIGKSGEYLYRNSGIAVTEQGTLHPSRLAARGGLGSVLGSKKIKAIIVEPATDRYRAEMVDKDRFNEANKKFNAALVTAAENSSMSQIGTAANTSVTAPMGILPVRNFSGEYFEEHEKIGANSFLERVKVAGGQNQVACQPGCIVRCSNHFNNPDGSYLTSGLEYETVALCGSNLDLADLDEIAKIDRFCDDFGIDTIETGATLGVCMDMKKIPWGDVPGIWQLLNEMEAGTEFGKIMGGGTEVCGKYLGSKRIPTAKGQAMPAYEPRNLKGTGVTYAMSAMGADHTAGITLGVQPNGEKKELGIESSLNMQILLGFADSTMCLMTWMLAGASNLGIVEELFMGMYGVKMDYPAIVEHSKHLLQTERAFNIGAGFTKEDDVLPEFFYTEASKMTGAVFDFSPEEMQTVYDFK